MRSIRSWIVERIIARHSNKKVFTDKKRFARFLKGKYAENEKRYVLPGYLKKRFRIKREILHGMDYYVFNQTRNTNKPPILYLHGGGYVNHPLIFHWLFLGKIAKKTSATIYVPIYPKAPNHYYKDSFDKVLPMYKHVLSTSDNDHVILMGDSAGGGLALALAQLLLEKGLPQPRHMILLSPWLDITLKNPDAHALERKDPMLGIYGLIQIGKVYARETDPNYYLLSPINGKIRGLRDITLFVGTHEILLPDARKFKELAASQGITINYREYQKMHHVFPFSPIPEAKRAIKEMVEIINSK